MIDSNTILGNRYRIVRLLGGGGMKQVYLAEDTRLANRRCALAEMIESFADPADAKAAAAAFAREADLLAQLSHDRIVRVYDKFSDANRHYLVMEYVEGLTLEEILSAAPNGRLEEKFVLDVAAQVVTALEYLHSQTPPIVYRDLKPANIMVMPDGGVKLIDFGVARLFVSKKTATMVGTLGYAPPEQYEGKAEPRSDIYALGATILHLLTGWNPGHHAPFMIPPIGTLRKDLTPALAALLAESLTLEPRRRISSATAFRRALEAIRGSAEATPAPAAPKPSSFAAKAAAPSAADSSAPTVVTVPHLLCPRCGHAVALAVRYCTYCRADLKDTALAKAKAIQPAIKWRCSTSGSVRALTIDPADGSIYVAIAGVNGSDGSVCALDSASGRLEWSFSSQAEITALAIGPRGTVYAGVAGTGLRDGDPYELAPAEGNPKRSLAAAFVARAIAVGPEGTIYAAGGAEDGDRYGNVHAIKPSWGSHKWSFSAARAITTLAAAPDGKCLYGGAENVLFALDPAGGECKWKLGVGQHLRWSVALSDDASREWSFVSGVRILALAVGADGGIYAGADDGHVYAIGAFGNWRWSFAAGSPVSTIAVGGNGTVYAGADGNMYALSGDGSPKWSFAAPGAIGQIAAGSDGAIYAGLAGGGIYAFQL